METNGQPSRPTPAEAEAALRDIDEARATVTSQQAPWWYFVGLGVLLALVPAFSLPDDSALGVLALFGGIAVWALGLGLLTALMVKKVGVVHRVSSPRARNTLLASVLVPVVVLSVLYLVFDLDWAVPAFAWLAAASCLGYGLWLAVSRRGGRVAAR